MVIFFSFFLVFLFFLFFLVFSGKTLIGGLASKFYKERRISKRILKKGMTRGAPLPCPRGKNNYNEEEHIIIHYLIKFVKGGFKNEKKNTSTQRSTTGKKLSTLAGNRPAQVSSETTEKNITYERR